MDRSEERIEARNVSLYPSDWALVDRLAERSGVRSTSGALRMLIAEYRALVHAQANLLVAALGGTPPAEE